MKNITITLDERTAAWVRVYAARHNTSISRIVGELLRQRMVEVGSYEEAMRCFLSKKPVRLSKTSRAYPSRDDSHDRSGLR